jgi:hypothetical protein
LIISTRTTNTRFLKPLKKGEKGFVVWGKKMKAKDKTEAKKTGNPDDEKEFKFFPISHVFSNYQVEEKPVE